MDVNYPDLWRASSPSDEGFYFLKMHDSLKAEVL